jgi:hypothetical protein
MSSGICWSPARNSIIGSPSDHQIVVMATAGMVRSGSLRNGMGSRPSPCMISPIRPASGARMKRQISVTIVTDSTEEEKKRPRKIAAPRVALLRARARSKAMIVSGGTISSAYLKVLSSAWWKTGSAARRV